MRRLALAITTLALIGLPGHLTNAIAQQGGTVHHRYHFSAGFTSEGMKNLQKQTASGFRAGVAKFFESAGGKLESWYFDYGNSTAYGFVDYPDEISAATAQTTVNAAGLARVLYQPVLSAEETDKALARSMATRPPQQQ
jgi:uncharacterized protein with GYD domain